MEIFKQFETHYLLSFALGIEFLHVITSQTVTDTADIVVFNKKEIAYNHSIGIFTFLPSLIPSVKVNVVLISMVNIL